MRYIILAQSRLTASAVETALQLLGVPLESPLACPTIVWDSYKHKSLSYTFKCLALALEEAANTQGALTKEVTVVVDVVNQPNALDVVGTSGKWESLLAMLILIFPEYHWRFQLWGSSQSDPETSETATELGKLHKSAMLLKPDGFHPLFDMTGLREWIRENTNNTLRKENDDLKLPLRKELAGVVEEEQAYLYYNAYCAYRFGFRVDLIDAWTRMRKRFGAGAKVPHPYWLLLEDMSLNFPDRENGIKLHSLDNDERAKHCPSLNSYNAGVEGSRYRVMVTTGQTRPGDDTLERNLKYLGNKKYGKGTMVLKPAGGMFDLWKQAGLLCSHKVKSIPGYAPSYQQPSTPDEYGESDGHGAPGKLLLVAEKLIERSERLKSQVISVADAVLGASLATDALELTGFRTPTTAIEALSLKHQFEVMAECQFSGVQYNIDMNPRINEIKRDLDVICEWFGKKKQNIAKLNARAHILNQLIRVLREYNQFDEEQTCMNEVRKLNSTLWMKNRYPRYFCKPFIWYVELLLNSFLGFVGWVGVWIFVLTLAFSCWPADSAILDTLTYGERLGVGLENAFSSFFSVGPPIQHFKFPDNSSIGFVVVSIISIISGFLHLGVLISHLYALVSRK